MKNFITTWKTDKQIKIGTSNEENYNYTIEWGDGKVDHQVSGDIMHSYDSAGTYTVEISGTFPRLLFNKSGDDNKKLLSVEQWGDIEWQSMNRAFYNCTNLVINALDVPDLSRVTDLSLMFNRARAFNQNINSWDVSAVTNMGWMFNQAHAFNQNINNWDVSAVTNMSLMFNEAHAFNQDISNWDVSAVTNMSGLFAGVYAFNQNINSWDVSAVTNMDWMFAETHAFNQNISDWDVSSVTKMDWMFAGAYAFNQNISDWDVSAVTKMDWMFNRALAFNQNINSWDVSAVKDMKFMFNRALAFANYDALLVGWSNRSLQNNVMLDMGNLKYSSESQPARDVLTETFNWTINDGGVFK